MSQSYYTGNHPQQHYPSSCYDTAQSHTPAYDDYYYNSVVAPGAHVVDDSSVLAQSYNYSGVSYAPDTTSFSSYVSAPDHTVSHYPDSVNQIPHQAAPGQRWAGPVQYTEDTTAQPSEHYDQRRGSCASSTSWYSQDNGHYEHPSVEQTHYHQTHTLQQQRPESMNFGMYSPTQYLRTQELARNSVVEPNHAEVVTPYGTLPVYEPNVKLERRSSDAFQTFDNSPIIQSPPTHFSPFIQSYPPSIESPTLSNVQTEEDSDSTVSHGGADLYAQQRRAANYQHGLRVQQELKYQLSGQLEHFETNAVNNQEYAQHHHHHHHQHHHQHQSSSSNHPLATPVVPSQARERIPSHVHTSPEVEEKKETPSKKPALACLFCRKRKIACGPPSPENPDRTCNQCARRRQTCEYPTESRRGVRKTTKEPVPEEPTVHKFVHGDAGAHEGTGPVRRTRRKRSD
ncbi:fungal Zn, 2-cys(6) binuclear cluster domain protein [Rhizoctonia solani 123E]|uniref:Fungal Zn, 2-cys(6) binuclear cluster domain protein n=1 Tax=Rhizoctonia solani 123E TaxID=1423351 RepID=A0A074SPN3_9AGAM|nr:fungal Zn, 2-cys(6) binuclear cluster domain protein [Rhizoctonia solani 123E]